MVSGCPSCRHHLLSLRSQPSRETSRDREFGTARSGTQTRLCGRIGDGQEEWIVARSNPVWSMLVKVRSFLVRSHAFVPSRWRLAVNLRVWPRRPYTVLATGAASESCLYPRRNLRQRSTRIGFRSSLLCVEPAPSTVLPPPLGGPPSPRPPRLRRGPVRIRSVPPPTRHLPAAQVPGRPRRRRSGSLSRG